MKNLIKLSTAICGAILTLLGFSACIPMEKYGMPPNEIVSGKVTDRVSGKPIKGIKVTNRYASDAKYGVTPANYQEFTAFTDQDGNYIIFGEEMQPHLTFNDVDGAENGLYNDTTVTVDVNNIALTPKK